MFINLIKSDFLHETVGVAETSTAKEADIVRTDDWLVWPKISRAASTSLASQSPIGLCGPQLILDIRPSPQVGDAPHLDGFSTFGRAALPLVFILVGSTSLPARTLIETSQSHPPLGTRARLTLLLLHSLPHHSPVCPLCS